MSITSISVEVRISNQPNQVRDQIRLTGSTHNTEIYAESFVAITCESCLLETDVTCVYNVCIWWRDVSSFGRNLWLSTINRALFYSLGSCNLMGKVVCLVDQFLQIWYSKFSKSCSMGSFGFIWSALLLLQNVFLCSVRTSWNLSWCQEKMEIYCAWYADFNLVNLPALINRNCVSLFPGL